MWADALLLAERGHLARVLTLGAASLAVGLALLALLARRRPRPALPLHFGLQMLAWGAAEVTLAWLAWRGLHLRDHEGAARLATALRVTVALSLGFVAVGLTLAVGGWRIARRPGPVGAGIATILHGVALLVLDARLLGAVRL